VGATCPHCDGAGYYVEAVPYGHPNFAKPLPCVCKLGERRTRSETQALARLGDELGSLVDKTFDSFDLDRPLAPLYEKDGLYYHNLARVPMADRPQAKQISVEVQAAALLKACDAAESYARHYHGWLVLHGAYGAGKSHLAAAIAHYGIAAGMSTRYRSLPGLFDALKAGFENDTSAAIFEDVISCDLLILDDLFDSDMQTDWRKSRLFRLFNERETRPTVITSNRRMDDLVPASDVDAGRLLSRIAGNATQVWLPISDYRRLRKERVA
jgi:DNA replication protein DnaC